MRKNKILFEQSEFILFRVFTAFFALRNEYSLEFLVRFVSRQNEHKEFVDLSLSFKMTYYNFKKNYSQFFEHYLISP